MGHKVVFFARRSYSAFIYNSTWAKRRLLFLNGLFNLRPGKIHMEPENDGWEKICCGFQHGWIFTFQPLMFQGGIRYTKGMDVSENSGTPISSTLIGFSIINHPFWGTTIFGNTHLEETKCIILPIIHGSWRNQFPQRLRWLPLFHYLWWFFNWTIMRWGL